MWRWRGFAEHLQLAFLYFAARHSRLTGGRESLRPAVLAVGFPRRRHGGWPGGSSSQPQEVGAGRDAQAQKDRKAGVMWHPEARGSPPRGRENETQVCGHSLGVGGWDLPHSSLLKVGDTLPLPAACTPQLWVCLLSRGRISCIHRWREPRTDPRSQAPPEQSAVSRREAGAVVGAVAGLGSPHN